MKTLELHTENPQSKAGACFLALLAIFFLTTSAEAQNTKGDRPAGKLGGSIFHMPRGKVKTKHGDKAYTRDITGRKRIRTKDKSSASHITYEAPNPYKDRGYKKRGDRPTPARGRIYNQPPRGKEKAWKGTRDGSPLKIRSISAKGARSNVYPQTGPYVNNKSTLHQKPKVSTRTARGKKIYQGKRSKGDRAYGGGPNYGSISGPYVKRGRKNVYWGKVSKGERPYTNDLTGRPLRTRNFHSADIGVGSSDTVKTAHRRPHRDQANSSLGGGYVTTSGGGKAWVTDISGHRIRRRPPAKGERHGILFEAEYRPSPKGEHRGEKLHGGGYKTFGKGRGSNSPLPPRQPGIGANGINKFTVKGNIAPGFSHAGGNYRGNIKSRRPGKGGGSISGKNLNNNGQPIEVRGPGIGSQGIGNFSGNIKSRRSGKGGGSISGKHFNNNGQPIEVRGPGIGSQGIGSFRGHLQVGEVFGGFSHAGGRYQGNIKTKRPAKSGGSISGQHFNNNGQSISVRAPGVGAQGIGKYRGKLLVSEIFGGYGHEGGDYRGKQKTRRPSKGGGSVSGKLWNNDGQPIQGRFGAAGFEKPAHFKGNELKSDIVPQFGRQGFGYSGSIKASKPKHGGGSVSGKLWNNDGQPIAGTFGAPGFEKPAHFSGHLKGKKPEHGGGSVSNRPMNNGGDPVTVHPPSRYQGNAAGFEGKTRLPLSLWNYVQNPNAHEKSIKKRKPNSNIYLAENLQVVVPQPKYQKNPRAAKGAMLGVGPGKGSTEAATYDHAVKQVWTYKHSPSSYKDALDVRGPGKSFTKLNQYQGRTKQGSYVHNPSTNKYSLNVIAPGKAYARINDYQGNAKMRKYNDHRFHPDSQFAHGSRDNTKDDRTLLMNVKLLWAKWFKTNDGQPEIVKEKVSRKPRYDKKEKELWKDLYD